MSNTHATLTTAIAWNGVGDPGAVMQAGENCPAITEVLVAPMDVAAEKHALVVARQFSKVRVIEPGDTGIYNAWNKLINACRTSHIAFHGIDDLVRADHSIEKALAETTEQELLVFSVQFATPDGTPTAVYHHREWPQAYSLGRLANPAGPEVAWPLTAVRAAGGLDESFRIAGDVDLWFRVRPNTTRRDSETILLTMRDGGISVRAKSAGVVWRENREIARRNGQKLPLVRLVVAACFLLGRDALFRVGGEKFADRVTDVAREMAGKQRRYSLIWEQHS